MTINRVANWLICVAAVTTAWSAGVHDAAAEEPVVSVVTDREPGPAASHGLEKLTAALSAQGSRVRKGGFLAEAAAKFLIVAGLAGGDGPAARLLKAGNHPVPQGPEALVIRRTEWQGKPVWVIAGSDDRGLMYAELDVADRIGWSTDRQRSLERGARCGREAGRAGAGPFHLHDEPGLLGKPLLRRGLLGSLSGPAGAEPLQLAGRDLRLRERRFPGAVLSVFLRRRAVPRRAHGRHHAATSSSATSTR